MFFETLVKNLSYLGFFLSGLISSSTIFVPLPFYFIILLAPKFGLNSIVAAIFAAIGASIGEVTSYFIGQGISFYSWKKIKRNKTYKKMIKLFGKFGSGILFFFAISPLPFDVLGITCGFLRYDLKKFLIITFFGKMIKMLIIVYFGEIALNYLGW